MVYDYLADADIGCLYHEFEYTGNYSNTGIVKLEVKCKDTRCFYTYQLEITRDMIERHLGYFHNSIEEYEDNYEYDDEETDVYEKILEQCRNSHFWEVARLCPGYSDPQFDSEGNKEENHIDVETICSNCGTRGELKVNPTELFEIIDTSKRVREEYQSRNKKKKLMNYIPS